MVVVLKSAGLRVVITPGTGVLELVHVGAGGVVVHHHGNGSRENIRDDVRGDGLGGEGGSELLVRDRDGGQGRQAFAAGGAIFLRARTGQNERAEIEGGIEGVAGIIDRDDGQVLGDRI